MKKPTAAIVALLSAAVLLVLTQPITASDPVGDLLAQITQERLWNDLAGLTGQVPVTVGGSSYTLTTRYTGSGTPITKATQYYYERCLAAGLVPTYFTWSSQGYSGRNVICEKAGTTRPDEVVVAVAHIDDIADNVTNLPGADDNATGVAALLAGIDLMAATPTDRTVRFVAVTGEEQGLLGSTAYAQSLLPGEVVAALSLDMIGWNASGTEPECELWTRVTTDGGYAADRAIADTFAGIVNDYALPLVPTVLANSLEWSDHAPFWALGSPAILVIEDYTHDINPAYHTPGDSVGKLDLAYYTAMVQAGLGTVARLAGVSASGCTPLASPAGLSATATGASTIDLTWTPVESALQYRVYRSTTAGGPYSYVAQTTSTWATDQGLASGTTYSYVVRSVATGGCESADSAEASATTFSPPTARLTASPATIQPGQSSTLTWTTTNAVSASINNGVGTVPVNGSQAVTPTTTTKYTLTATGPGGTATATATVTVSQPVAAPANLTASVVSSTQVRLSWRDNANNETGFVVERCSGADCTGFAQIATVGSKYGTGGTVTYTNSGLAAGTYGYRVKAVKGTLSSAYSNVATVTVTGSSVPGAPTSLQCSVSGASDVACSWRDNSTNETGFALERCKGSTCTTFAQIAAPAAQPGSGTTVSYTDRSLAAGTYRYRVKAVNAAGSSAYSNTASATVAASGMPAAPSNLVCSQLSPTAIRCTWTDNSTNETSFQAQDSLDGFATVLSSGTLGANVTTVDDTDLVTGKTYSLRVRAVNSSGSSAWSNVATVTLR